MKTKLYITNLIGFLLFISMFSCKTKQELETKKNKELPTAYQEKIDTSNLADINWKNFFDDNDLISLIDEALKNNIDLAIALQKIQQAQINTKAKSSAMLPTLNANLNYLGKKFGYYTMDDAGNRVTEIEPGVLIPTYLPDYYLGLQTNWEIDVWGKLKNKKRAAFTRYLSSLEGKNLVITNLVAEVANNYYELLALDNELSSIKESIQLQQTILDNVIIQKEAGKANDLEVKQFEAQLNGIKAMEVETMQKITQVENQINYLLNRYPQPIKRNSEVLSQALTKKIVVGIPSDLLKNRPDIRQAEFELMATKFDIKAAKAAFYPTLNVSAMFGYQGFKTNLLFTTPQSLAYTLFGSLVAPLLNRSAIKAEFKTANSLQQEALLNYQKSILNAYTEVYNELINIKNLEKINEHKTNQVTTLKQAIDASTILFKSGRANYIEVLFAQQNALNSKIELINVKQNQYQALVNIYKALGGGWK